MVWGFLLNKCPSCHPTVTVKALKETQSTNPNQWPDPVLSLDTTRYRMKGLRNRLCRNLPMPAKISQTAKEFKITNKKPQRRVVERKSLVDVSGEPVLNGHVPCTHSLTYGRRQLTSIQVEIVNRAETILDVVIAVATTLTISSRVTGLRLSSTCVADMS